MRPAQARPEAARIARKEAALAARSSPWPWRHYGATALPRALLARCFAVRPLVLKRSHCLSCQDLLIELVGTCLARVHFDHLGPVLDVLSVVFAKSAKSQDLFPCPDRSQWSTPHQIALVGRQLPWPADSSRKPARMACAIASQHASLCVSQLGAKGASPQQHPEGHHGSHC